MAIRKGAKVKYIGTKYEHATGQIFTVRHKFYSHIEVLFPTKYLDGSIHGQICSMPISEFEEVK